MDKPILRTGLRAALLVCLPAVLLCAPTARAQDDADKRAAAESLFQAGRDLFADGKIAEACSKFEASQVVLPAPGTLLNLALCHEREGQTATAWAEYQESIALAIRNNDPDRESFAREHATALEPDLPRLTVTVPPASRIDGLEIFRKDTPVPEGSWGAALPVDPGVVVVRASAPGRVTWQREVQARAAATVTVEIPLLQSLAAPEPAPMVSASPPPVVRAPVGPPPSTDVGPSRNQGLRTAAWIGGGVGVAALLVGGYYGVDAFRKHTQSDERCPGGNLCYSEGVELENEARSSARLANVLLGSGLVVVGVSAFTLAWTADDSAKPRDAGSTNQARWIPTIQTTVGRSALGSSAAWSF